MTIGPRIYIYILHTNRESGSCRSPPLYLSRPTFLTSRCFSAWQSASLKSECLLARPSRYFSSSPSLPIIHLSFSILIALFLLVVLPLSSSMHFFLFLLPPLTLTLSPFHSPFSFSDLFDVPLVLVTSFSFPSTRSNVLVARGSSVQRPSCIPEPPHCSFLEGKRENISARPETAAG